MANRSAANVSSLSFALALWYIHATPWAGATSDLTHGDVVYTDQLFDGPITSVTAWGDVLAVGSTRGVAVVSLPATTSNATDQPVRIIDYSKGTPTALSLSPDGAYLAVATPSSLSVWGRPGSELPNGIWSERLLTESLEEGFKKSLTDGMATPSDTAAVAWGPHSETPSEGIELYHLCVAFGDGALAYSFITALGEDALSYPQWLGLHETGKPSSVSSVEYSGDGKKILLSTENAFEAFATTGSSLGKVTTNVAQPLAYWGDDGGWVLHADLNNSQIEVRRSRTQASWESTDSVLMNCSVNAQQGWSASSVATPRGQDFVALGTSLGAVFVEGPLAPFQAQKQCIMTQVGSLGDVTAVGFPKVPEGAVADGLELKLLIGSTDGRVEVLEVRKGDQDDTPSPPKNLEEQITFGGGVVVTALAFHPTRDVIAFATWDSGGVHVQLKPLNVDGSSSQISFPHKVTSLTFSVAASAAGGLEAPAGHTLFVTLENGETRRISTGSSSEIPPTLQNHAVTHTAVFDIITQSPTGALAIGSAGSVSRWAHPGAPKVEVEVKHYFDILAMRFEPPEPGEEGVPPLFCVMGGDKVKGGKFARITTGDSDVPALLSFTSGEEGVVVVGAAVSPDVRYVAYLHHNTSSGTSEEGFISLFRREEPFSSLRFAEVHLDHNKMYRHVEFSLDGVHLIATSLSEVSVWSILSGVPRREFSGGFTASAVPHIPVAVAANLQRYAVVVSGSSEGVVDIMRLQRLPYTPAPDTPLPTEGAAEPASHPTPAPAIEVDTWVIVSMVSFGLLLVLFSLTIALLWACRCHIFTPISEEEEDAVVCPMFFPNPRRTAREAGGTELERLAGGDGDLADVPSERGQSLRGAEGAGVDDSPAV